jgi:hypothetical protein
MSHFKMRTIVSRLKRHGLAVDKLGIDAVSVSRERIYVNLVLAEQTSVDAAILDVDAALGKFANIIEFGPVKSNGRIWVLVSVNIRKLRTITEFEALSQQLGAAETRSVVKAMSETAQARTP